MTSRISYNADGKFIPNVGEFKAHLQRLQPAALVVMDALALAAEIKALVPTCTVIFRDYAGYRPDDDIHKRMTPHAYIDDQRSKGSFQIARYVLNEPAWDNYTITWLCEAMDYNASKSDPLTLVLGNYAVGNPNPDDFARGAPLFERLAKYRAWAILGLHEYFAAVPTSGFYGGYPNHAGVDPNGPDKDKGENLLPMDKWPKDTSAITLFHCGRFRFVVAACKKLQIPPPRIILTEHGADDVSDIKAWLDRLPQTPPYPNIRGWKSCVNFWSQQYPGIDAQIVYADALTYLDKNVYQESVVEAQCIFAFSNSPDQNWTSHNVAEAKTLQTELETAAKAPAPVIIPTVRPKPAAALTAKNIRVTSPIHVRFDASTSYLNIGYPSAVVELQPGDLATIWTDSVIKDGAGRDWVYVEIHTGDFQNRNGWVSQTDLKADVLATGEVPPVVIIPPVNTPPAPAAPDLKAVYDLLNTIDIQLSSIQQELRAVKDTVAQQINLKTAA